MPTPEPPQEYRFKPGQSGNPGGLTKEQAEKRRANRDKAVRLEEAWLDAALAIKEAAGSDAVKVLSYLNSDIRQVVNAAIERHDGKPTQQVDNTSSDGSAVLPSRIVLVGPDD